MQANLPAAKAAGHMEALKPVLKGVATLCIAALGMLLFSTVGSLAYPIGGVGAIVGGIAGVLMCFLFGCCVTGFWKDFLPKDPTFGATNLVPHGLAVQMGMHGNFTLVLTVARIEGVQVQGHMPWRKPDIFLEVECGVNPIKRTCVNNAGEFNEQFRLDVKAADESIVIKIRDQDVFGFTDIGHVCVDIQKSIIDSKFGHGKDVEFDIEAGENDKLRRPRPPDKARLLLRFDHTDDYPQLLRDPSTVQRNQANRDKNESEWKTKEADDTNYGAVSFLSKMEFNTHMKINNDDHSAKNV